VNDLGIDIQSPDDLADEFRVINSSSDNEQR